MIKDIVEAGGVGFLVPAVLFALLVMGVKGVSGLFSQKSKTRKEFLEHWDANRASDDVWLEVTVSHQFGVYLPARVIRLALQEPHKVQALMDISDIWQFLRLDGHTMKVDWRRPQHASPSRRALARRLVQLSYYGLAFAGALFGWVSYRQPANSLGAWTYALLALELVVVAAILPDREEALKTAVAHGDRWVQRINAAATAPTPAAHATSDSRAMPAEA